MGQSGELFTHVVCGHDLSDHTIHVQTGGVMAGIGLVSLSQNAALNIELVVIQAAAVRADAKIMAHIGAAQTLFPGHESLVQLFAVAGANDLLLGLSKSLHHTVGQIANRGGVGLLDKQIARFGMIKGESYKVHCLVKIHQKARHVRISDCNGRMALDLVDKERDDRAARAHNIAVTGTGQNRPSSVESLLRAGLHDLLAEGLAHTHGVDRVGGLVRGEEHDAFDPVLDRGGNDVIRADDVCAHGLHREKLTARHLLEGGGVEDVICTVHHLAHGVDIPHVADVELHLPGMLRILRLQGVAHGVLLLLIAGDDTDLSDVSGEIVF